MADTGNVLLAAGEPGTIVATGGPGSRTRADLLCDAAAAARTLPRPTAGAEVLLFCEDRYRFAAGLLGAWMAGFPVALPPNAQPETLRLLAARSTTAAYLHDGAGTAGVDLRAVFPDGADSPTVVAHASDSRTPSANARPRKAFANAPARQAPLAHAPLLLEPSRHLVTVYTSGSTGPYQPCPKTAAQLVGEADLHVLHFGVQPADRVLATVPAHHIYGLLFSVLIPLRAGAAFARTTPLLGEAVAAEIRANGATVLVTVPAHLRALALLGPGEFRGVRLLFSSGAALDAITAERVSHMGPDAFEILGSSETGGIATRRAASGPAWQPLPGVQVSAGEAGRLLLHSPFLDPDLSRPHPCADRIEMLGDGTFRHLGRIDDVVKVAGKRVALSDVEARLREQPGVTDAAVLAVPSARHGLELRAVAAGAGLDAALLRSALLRHFDATVVPRQVYVVAQLPLMENGKLASARLLALTGGGGGHDLPARPLGGDGFAQRFEVQVDASLPWFRGHFDDFPLLAGVVQLELIVAAQIRRSWPGLGAVRRLTRIKFRRPILPDQTLVLELVRSGAAVKFELRRGEDICSSGTLEFDGEAA